MLITITTRFFIRTTWLHVGLRLPHFRFYAHGTLHGILLPHTHAFTVVYDVSYPLHYRVAVTVRHLLIIPHIYPITRFTVYHGLFHPHVHTFTFPTHDDTPTLRAFTLVHHFTFVCLGLCVPRLVARFVRVLLPHPVLTPLFGSGFTTAFTFTRLLLLLPTRVYIYPHACYRLCLVVTAFGCHTFTHGCHTHLIWLRLHPVYTFAILVCWI